MLYFYNKLFSREKWQTLLFCKNNIDLYRHPCLQNGSA